MPPAAATTAASQPLVPAAATDVLSLLRTINASLPPAEAWRPRTPAHSSIPRLQHQQTRSASNWSAAISLMQPAAPLPPSLCCKCDEILTQEPLSPWHCCPCEPSSCPCDAFNDEPRSSMACRRSLKKRNCFALDGIRLCVCPKWQATAADSFSLVTDSAVALGPGWIQFENGKMLWPVVKSQTDKEQCATECIMKEGCTSFLDYMGQTCVLFSLLYFPWKWTIAGAGTYLRQSIDPTELKGGGECACRGQRMNRYYFSGVNSMHQCVQYCTASLGCLGIQTVSKRFLWPTQVPKYPQLRVQGYSYGCNIITTHRGSMLEPQWGQVEFVPGIDVTCTSIDSLIDATPVAQISECRPSKQDAMLG